MNDYDDCVQVITDYSFAETRSSGSLDASRGMWSRYVFSSRLQSPQLGHCSVTDDRADDAAIVAVVYVLQG